MANCEDRGDLVSDLGIRIRVGGASQGGDVDLSGGEGLNDPVVVGGLEQLHRAAGHLCKIALVTIAPLHQGGIIV